MGCEEIHAHLADHLAGTLPPEEAAAVAEHLRTCAACAAEAEGLDETWQVLGTLPPARTDSNAMRARFDAALEGYRQGLHVEPASTKGVRATWGYGLQFAAAAAILVLGVYIGRQTVPAQAAATDPQIADLRSELRDMREMVTLSLLQTTSASERLKGVGYSSQIEQPGAEVVAALLDTLMHDPNDNVRLRTIEALSQFAGRETVRRGAIEALPRQTSPLVQVALIDFVVQAGGREAAPALRQLSNDPMLDEAVRMRAAEGLRQIS